MPHAAASLDMRANPRPPGTNRRAAGDSWERAAHAHLQAAGLRMLAANARYRVGEIDLVMGEDDTIVFVEVRYRRRPDFGGSAPSVDAAKQRRLVRAARCFLAEHPALANSPCRFDVVAVDGHAEAPRIEWIRNAFDAD